MTATHVSSSSFAAVASGSKWQYKVLSGTSSVTYKPKYFTKVLMSASPHDWYYHNLQWTGGNGTTTATATGSIISSHNHFHSYSVTPSQIKWDGVQREIRLDYFNEYDEDNEYRRYKISLSPTSVYCGWGGNDYIGITAEVYCEKYVGSQFVGYGTYSNIQQWWGCENESHPDNMTLSISSMQTTKTESYSYNEWRQI